MKNQIGSASGFTLVEVLMGVSIGLVAMMAAFSLVQQKNSMVVMKTNSSDFAMSLQTISESLEIDGGINGNLTTGNHGPVQMTTDGRVSSNGVVTVSWNVIPDTPSPNILRIDITASRMVAGKQQTSAWTIYRQAPLQATSTVGLIATSIATPTPTPVPSPTPTPTPTWKYDTTGTCMDPGTQTRSAHCYLGAAVVSDTTCTSGGAGAQPATYNMSCANYVWQVGTWGACPSGTQTRTITCIHVQDGSTVDNSLCPPATQPAGTQACTPPSDQR